ncbi:terpene synthase family protein [Streptomyces badius]
MTEVDTHQSNPDSSAPYDRIGTAQTTGGAAPPPIWCPFPISVHPDVEGLNDDLVAWARNFSLIRSPEHEQQVRRADFGAFVARVHPDAQDLRLLAQWYLSAWLLDDLLDEEDIATGKDATNLIAAELRDQFRVDLEPPSSSILPNPLASACSDLWRRTAPAMSPEWHGRFLSHHRDYIASTVRDAQNYRDRPLDLGNYIRRRRINSWGQSALDLIEVAGREEVHPDVTNSDLHRSLRTVAVDVMSWTNDIFSYRREEAHGNRDNLVAALKASQSLTWREAVQAAIAMTETETENFIRACQDLQNAHPFYNVPPQEWRTVTQNLNAIGCWLAGSLDWHRNSGRYRIDDT